MLYYKGVGSPEQYLRNLICLASQQHVGAISAFLPGKFLAIVSCLCIWPLLYQKLQEPLPLVPLLSALEGVPDFPPRPCSCPSPWPFLPDCSRVRRENMDPSGEMTQQVKSTCCIRPKTGVRPLEPHRKERTCRLTSTCALWHMDVPAHTKPCTIFKKKDRNCKPSATQEF